MTPMTSVKEPSTSARVLTEAPEIPRTSALPEALVVTGDFSFYRRLRLYPVTDWSTFIK